MNKRGIKADPRGFGSSEKSALLRQDIIRTIEYDSNGPSVYASAYQQMVEGSYAFFRISRRYVTDQYVEEPADEQATGPLPQDINSRNRQLFQQEIVIKPILNPNSVLFDPDCKEPDWSDARACFFLEQVSRKEFKRRWPKPDQGFLGGQTSCRGMVSGRNILVVLAHRNEGKAGVPSDDPSRRG
jgi:hypothetical protein